MPDDRLLARSARSGSSSPRATTRYVRQELVETLYHVLWELVHVFFDHRGLLAGRDARRVHDAGASSFLYPFLAERERELEPVVENVRRSVLMKAEEIGALRVQTLHGQPRRAGGRGDGAARELRRRAASCSRSATAARPPTRWTSSRTSARRRRRAAARPAIDLTEDAAILTAIANDIGVDAIFSRQVIAYGVPGDALLALSTSGNSRNVIDALGQARRQGLATIALVGYDGGRVGLRATGRPRRDHPLRAHPPHPGGAGQRLPRAARARRARAGRGGPGVSARGAGGQGSRARPAALRARVQGTVQGVGFRPYVYRLAARARAGGLRPERLPRGPAGGRGRRAGAVEEFLGRLARDAPPLAVIERVITEDCEPTGEVGFAIRESPRGGAVDGARRARQRDLRGLPARAARSRRPPLPLPVHQLHQLRAALHDRSWHPLRPAVHDDGELHDVRALPGASTRTRPIAASTPSRTPARVRTLARRLWRPKGGPAALGVEPTMPCARRGRGAARRADRRGQGDRRLSPRLPCR